MVDKIIFPRDCWGKECPFFHAWDMSVDDWTAYCDKLEIQIDACDEDITGRLCPLCKLENV